MREGGDTDTNACIVGGMMGALLGMKSIPEDMRDKVMDFDCSEVPENDQNYGIIRPDFLSVKINLFANIQKLITRRPKEPVELVYTRK